MLQYQATCALEAAATLAEGPTWDADLERLNWVDIPAARVNRFDPATGENEVWQLPAECGFAAPDANGNFLCGTRDGLLRLDVTDGQVTALADPEAHLASRFNDGKTDSAGRLWAGTISDARDPECALYRIDRDLSVNKMLSAVTNSNGLAFSGDDRTLYYIDSQLRRVDAFDFEPVAGTLSHRRTVIEVPESLAIGKPDGMTIDAEGNLWLGMWGGGRVTHWNPNTGEQLGEVLLPCEQVTSCCFGGPELKQLYITTARNNLSDEQLAAQPLAGGLFVTEPQVAGLPTIRFAG